MEYRLGQYTIDTARLTLRYGSTPIDAPHRVIAALAALVAAGGEPISRATLLTRVWPDTHVHPNNVSQAIRAARSLLAERGGAEWIETLPGRGYRFAGPIEVIHPAVSHSPVSADRSHGGRRRLSYQAAAAVAALSLASSIIGFGITRSAPDPASVDRALAESRDLAATRTGNGLRAALARLQPVLDARYPDPKVLAAAAEVHHLEAFYELDDPLEANNAAERDARRALARDPTSARALAVLASVRLDRDWDLAGSASAFRRALDNDRDDVVAHHWSAWWLLAADRLDDARRVLEDASRINPLSPAVLTARSTFAYFAGDYTAAERSARAALETDPLAFRAHLRLGLIAVMRHDEASAMEHLETARRLAPEVPETLSALGHACASFAREKQARALLGELERRGRGTRFAFHRGMILMALGDLDAAAELLLDARRRGSVSLPLLRAEPRLASLRAHPSIVRMVSDVGTVQPRQTLWREPPFSADLPSMIPMRPASAQRLYRASAAAPERQSIR